MNQTNPEEISKGFSNLYWFYDVPNSAVAAGVYVVWQGDQLIYTGMSGIPADKNVYNKKMKLVTAGKMS